MSAGPLRYSTALIIPCPQRESDKFLQAPEYAWTTGNDAFLAGTRRSRYNRLPFTDRTEAETTTISSQSYKAAARLFLIAMVFTHAFFLWTVRERIARGDPDFTVYYTAGKILREGRGHQLYDPSTQQVVQQEFTSNADVRRGPLPYLHPPFEALIFLPLTFLSYSRAFLLWGVVNLGLLCVTALVLRTFLISLREVSLFDLLLLSLGFFPVFANFHQGQDAILLLLVVSLSLRAMSRKAEFEAGCWIGLGLFKYHLILPLILIVAFWKGRRFLLGVMSSAALTALLSIGLVGWQGTWQYPHYVWRVISEPGFGRIPFRQLPNLLGLLAGWPYLENCGLPLHLLVLACSGALLIFVASLRRLIDRSESLKLGIAVAIIAALLTGYSTNTYDLSLLLLSLALIAEYCRIELQGQARRQLSLVLPVLPLLISPLWFLLWMKWSRINVIAVFLLWWLYAIEKEILQRRVSAYPLVTSTASSGQG